MAQGVRKLLAVAGINGEVQALEQLFERLHVNGADAVPVVGDLGAPGARRRPTGRSSERSERGICAARSRRRRS